MQVAAKTEPIYSREADNKREPCRPEGIVWGLFEHSLVVEENGHQLPFWIFSPPLQTIIHDSLTSGNHGCRQTRDSRRWEKRAWAGYIEVERLFLCYSHLLSYLRGGL